jgi:ABC-type antimicrobial peptide transport system permease subunit
VLIEAQLMMVNPVNFSTMDYAFGIVCSILFIYLVSAACALYPAYLAAGIDAATALHDE